MSRQWMPLYIADYLKDTMHLTAAESGAYLHLIMHYWTAGFLPTDERKLARIARMTDREWNRSRDTIAEFFDSDWMHTRIERELARNAELSNKRSEAAKQKLSKRSANAEHLDTQSQSQIPSTSVEAKASTGADAPPEPDPSIAEREFFARGKAVLGKSAGGLLANLLRAKGGNVSLARAALETASTKENPAEYVAAASRGPPLAAGGKPLTQFQKDQQTARNIIDELDSFARGSGRRDEAAAGLLPNYSGK